MTDFDTRFDRIEERLDSYQGETRELVISMLEVVRDNAAAMRELAASLGEFRHEFKRESRDSREQLRANTEAVLRMLDHLGNGGPAPAGT